MVVLTPHQDLAASVREAVASGTDALAVAGGDGSLGPVAAIAAADGLPFACVPAGTKNHFALDLGIDRHNPISALYALTDGIERGISPRHQGVSLAGRLSPPHPAAHRRPSGLMRFQQET